MMGSDALLEALACAACGPHPSTLPFCGLGGDGACDEEIGAVERGVGGAPLLVLPLDALEAVGSFAPMEAVAPRLVLHAPSAGSLIYVSHEALGDEAHDAAKFALLIEALRHARDAAPDPASPVRAGAHRSFAGRLRECVSDPRGCYLWGAPWCVPRDDAPARRRHLASRRAFLEAADAMIVLAPRYVRNGEVLGLGSYRRRGWARFEQLAFRTARPDAAGCPCYVFEDAASLDAFRGRELADPAASPSASVFRGRFGCCESDHVVAGRPVPCDRRALLRLVAGVHAARLARADRADDGGAAYRNAVAREWVLYAGAEGGGPAYADAAALAAALRWDPSVSPPLLHYAALADDAALVAELLDRGDAIDATDGDGATALDRAVAGGAESAAALLRDRGAKTGYPPR